MNAVCETTVDENAMESVTIEVKMHINQRLFQKGAITEEMYTRAKELILKGN